MQLDLSSLSGPELRQLLDSARQRGQAAQSYQILQEMDRRRVGGGPRRRIRARRGDEPRVISLDLGDPLSRPDPAMDVPPAPSLHDETELSLAREPRPIRKTLRPPWTLAGFSAGLAVGAALGVHAAGRGPAPAASESAPVEVAAAPLPPAPVVPIAQPAEVVAPATPLEVAVVSPDAVDAAPVVPAPVAVAKVEVEVAEAPVDVAATESCAIQPTPADRTICADPDLRRLQHELRQAYAGALDAHRERGVLRQRQLAWREARNDLVEPARLAEMYEDRIRRLNAAAADARRRR